MRHGTVFWLQYDGDGEAFVDAPDWLYELVALPNLIDVEIYSEGMGVDYTRLFADLQSRCLEDLDYFKSQTPNGHFELMSTKRTQYKTVEINVGNLFLVFLKIQLKLPNYFNGFVHIISNFC